MRPKTYLLIIQFLFYRLASPLSFYTDAKLGGKFVQKKIWNFYYFNSTITITRLQQLQRLHDYNDYNDYNFKKVIYNNNYIFCYFFLCICELIYILF